MHEIRSLMNDGGKRETLAAKKGSGLDRARGSGLASIAIAREEARKTNQRREDRLVNVADRAEIVFRRKRYEVHVANVSAHGVMIESDIEPRIGERIHVSFEGCNRTQCTVRWLKDRHIGLEFAQETVLIAPREVRDYIVSGRREGEQPPRIEIKQDRPPRQRLFWSGTLYYGVDQSEVRLHNISANGAMLDCGEDLMVGTVVVLELAGGGANALQGRVRWCRSGQIGIAFDAPFDMRILAEVKPSGKVESIAPRYVKPDYLTSEGKPESPWASRTDRLSVRDL